MFPRKTRLKAILPVLTVLLLSLACYFPGEEVPEGESTDINTLISTLASTRPANTVVQPPASTCSLWT